MLAIEQIKDTIEEVVNKYPVKKVSIFGSCARGSASEDSDIDFLVEFVSPVENITVFGEQRSLTVHKRNQRVNKRDKGHGNVYLCFSLPSPA